MESQSDLCIVYQGSATETQQVQNMLEAKGIDSFLQNANMGSLFPNYGGFGSRESVKLLVKNEDVNRANDIIKIYLD